MDLPGILWMDYQMSHDNAVRTAAEGYTNALRGIAYRPCYDHDIGFLMFCSYGKGYEVNHSQDYKNVICFRRFSRHPLQSYRGYDIELAS